MNDRSAADRTEQGTPWRFKVEPRTPAPLRFLGEGTLSRAWLGLQLDHTPFRANDQELYATLMDRLAALEEKFFEHKVLAEYHAECNMLEPLAGPPTRLQGRSQPLREPRIRFAATLQAELMEQVYFVLQLGRYANAPDNRGWMNLFRRWGRSPTFNRQFDECRATLTLELVEFYDLYLRYYPFTIDQDPVPHPWDAPARRQDPRLVPDLDSRDAAEEKRRSLIQQESVRPSPSTESEFLPGIYLDTGIHEARPSTRRSDERPVPQAGSGAHGGPVVEATGLPRDEQASGSAPEVPNE
jgi:hypothetical protein